MSMFSRGTYPVGTPTRVCAATGRPLVTGERFVAALVQVGDEGGGQGGGAEAGYERRDFAMEAWLAGSRPVDSSGRRLPVLGSWRGEVPEPGAKKRMLIDDEALLELFEQSAEGGGEEADRRRVFRFMLALILIRKRLLVCEKTDAQGRMWVRPRGSPKSSEGGVLSEVEDPGLSEESAARAAEQLSAVLDGDSAGAAPSSPAAPVGAEARS